MSGSTKMPRRPAYATLGRPIVLRANYFNIVPGPDLQLFRYHVEFKPEAKAHRLIARVMELFLAQAPFFADLLPAVATDGRSTIITVKKLKLGAENRTTGKILYYEAEEAGPRAENPKTYEFTITYTNTLGVQELMDYLQSTDITTEYEPKEAVLQALNIAMMRKPLSSPDVTGRPGRNKFFPIGAVLGNLGGGLIALRGYYTSVRTATLRLLLNANSITATFYQPGPLTDLFVAFKQSCTDKHMESALHAFVKGIRVEVTHLKTKVDKDGRGGKYRTKPIQGLAMRPKAGANAREVRFFYEEAGREITVDEYYRRSKWHPPFQKTSGRTFIDADRHIRVQHHAPEVDDAGGQLWPTGSCDLDSAGAAHCHPWPGGSQEAVTESDGRDDQGGLSPTSRQREARRWGRRAADRSGTWVQGWSGTFRQT